MLLPMLSLTGSAAVDGLLALSTWLERFVNVEGGFAAVGTFVERKTIGVHDG